MAAGAIRLRVWAAEHQELAALAVAHMDEPEIQVGFQDRIDLRAELVAIARVVAQDRNLRSTVGPVPTSGVMLSGRSG